MMNPRRHAPFLRWTFYRDGRFLTCQVTPQTGGRLFTLSVIPHFEGADEQAETFASGISAVQRHAVIAQTLRASGWVMAAYSAPPAVARAA